MEAKWTSRKFLVFWILTAGATMLLLKEVLTSDNFVDLIVFVWAAYVAGNVGEHFATNGNHK